MNNHWELNSWRNFEVNQQPCWPDIDKLKEIIIKLRHLPSVVFSGETRNLKQRLVEVEDGNAFIIQAGNCAESFSDCHGPEIHNYLRIMQTMSDVLQASIGKPVIKIGRIAGQYGKPRSNNIELVDGVNLPVYRGDNVNSANPKLGDRIPNPSRLLEGYFRSTATLNLIRAFTQGSYADENYRYDWHEFPYSQNVKESELFKRYVTGLSRGFKNSINKGNQEIYISHEALILEYEEAFTRIDTTKGGFYNTCAHFLWLGDRTRGVKSAHVEYLRGIENPVGIKIGPSSSEDEILNIIRIINPKNEKGKIVLIVRYGIEHIENMFKNLVKTVKENSLNVVWMIDPMHGNTKQLNRKKIRYFSDILNEIKIFFRICEDSKIIPGGLHLEMTSKLVTECVGGSYGVNHTEIEENYESLVDPRLNGSQVIELILEVTKLIK